MGQNHDTPNPFRRLLLAALPAAGLAASIPTIVRSADNGSRPTPAEHPDSSLIQACFLFEIADDQLQAMNADTTRPDPDPAFEALHDDWWELAHGIMDIPAVTSLGLRQKAAAFLRFQKDVVGEPTADDDIVHYFAHLTIGNLLAVQS